MSVMAGDSETKRIPTQAEHTDAAARFDAALRTQEAKDIEFVWKGTDADPNADQTLRAAFTLSSQSGLLEFEPLGLLDEYYISDVPQFEDGDSRALTNKYRVERKRLLHDGNRYYLCQVSPYEPWDS